jgi:hypothetical protein
MLAKASLSGRGESQPFDNASQVSILSPCVTKAAQSEANISEENKTDSSLSESDI